MAKIVQVKLKEKLKPCILLFYYTDNNANFVGNKIFKHTEMKKSIPERLSALRESMKQHKIDAFIIPTSDPHMSEYPAACWKYREWISGFTGSFGTIVVTADKAGLWTDSRYFLQSATQLAGSGIDLYKMKIEGTPTIPQFLTAELKKGQTVGLNGLTYSMADAESLEKALKRKGIALNSGANLLDAIWEDRPAIPDGMAFEMPVKLSGKSTEDKLIEINNMLHQAGADFTILSSLDEVAWTFNIRGTDVKYNPVLISYAYISEKEVVLFADPKKIPAELAEKLKKEGVKLAAYDKFYEYLGTIPANSVGLLEMAHTNVAVANALPKSCELIDGISPANHLKSIKNETELKGFKSAMVKDGIALTKFYMWLEKKMAAGEKVTELSASHKLTELRAAQPLCIMDSFASISSYGPHGAVVHYAPTPETDVELKPDNLYLLDSGAQYMDGTTDITRTIALCEPTDQMKKDFTRGLKGTIGIAKCKFPAGIRGCLIDAFARKAFWDAGINYLHGTCHGIGHCLNVHEGPQSIRMEENPVILEPGMVMSDEPAMYRTGQYGIRTENMVVIHEDSETEFGKFLSFETITLCFIDTRLVDVSMLSAREHAWLNRYHQMVYDKLAPHLNEEEKAWLRKKTAEI
jgi:Xaa-Pro aminopeptidase